MKNKSKRKGIIALLAVVLVAAITLGAYAVANAQKEIPTTVATQTDVTVYSNTKAKIDASNLSEGYVIITYTGGENVRIRAQITKSGGTTYTYEISNSGKAEVLPLTEGNGTYTVKVFEQVSGNSYAVAYSQDLSYSARNELLPFLYPNQYVNYTANSGVTKLAESVVASASSQLDKVTAVYNHVVGGSYTYDYDLAKNVSSTYLPTLESFIVNKKGICFDYASLMTAMLRSEGIPARLVIGYANSASGEVVYHAWIDVYTQETGWIDSAIQFDGVNWSLVDPTYISTGNRSDSVLSFVADTTNYSAKYVY